MKKIVTAIVLLIGSGGFAQNGNDLDAIKLYIDKQVVASENVEHLNASQADRLFQRTSQLINQVGITEYGYSTFLVTPKLDVISVTESNAGIANTVLAECELFLTIKRVMKKNNENGASATMNTFSKRIMGSGRTKSDAISNAITNVRSGDQDIINFFADSKKKIDAYYKAHCKEVLQEANQALAMKDYAKSISLSFSIPRSAACYDEASQLSQKVYAIYVQDNCKDQILKMKSYAALAERDPSQSDDYYSSILAVMEEIGSSDRAAECRAVAEKVIADIEKKLDEKQKREWELEKASMKMKTSCVKKSIRPYKAFIATTHPQPT
jgi:hypothetical protein